MPHLDKSCPVPHTTILGSSKCCKRVARAAHCVIGDGPAQVGKRWDGGVEMSELGNKVDAIVLSRRASANRLSLSILGYLGSEGIGGVCGTSSHQLLNEREENRTAGRCARQRSVTRDERNMTSCGSQWKAHVKLHLKCIYFILFASGLWSLV